MEETPSSFDEKKKRLPAELEKQGIIKSGAHVKEDPTLERLLYEPRNDDPGDGTRLVDSNMRSNVFDYYIMMTTDYFIKLALAGLFLYWSYARVPGCPGGRHSTLITTTRNEAVPNNNDDKPQQLCRLVM